MSAIVSANVTPYRLRLRQPLKTAVGSIADRRGLLLYLEDGQGRQGVGDAAPLPGFSDESYEQAEAALRAVSDPNGLLRGQTFDSSAAVDDLCSRLALPAAASHAIEQALLDLLAQGRGLPLCHVLCDGDRVPRDSVPVHALVADPQQAREAIGMGFDQLKLKVGAAPISDDDARIAAIRAAIGPTFKLRLDANGAWDETSARAALARFARHDVSCVEQPVPAGQIASLAHLRADSPIPIAADEAVRTLADLHQIVRQNAADAIVIKPMLCGGLLRALAMADYAATAGLPVSVTTTLESAVGRLGALHLAAAVPGQLWSCGLCTDTLLAEDVLSGPRPSAGALRVPSGLGLGLDGSPTAGAI